MEMRDMYIIGGLAFAALVAGVFVFQYKGSISPTALSVSTIATEARSVAAVAVPFTELARGARSTVATRVNYRITSADELNKLWEMIDAKEKPPTIDFNTQEVIAVFAGQKSTGGYGISVSKIMDAQARTVSILLTKPSVDCIVTESFTNPYQIVAVARSDASLAHTDTESSTPCN